VLAGADDGAGLAPVEQALISTSNVNPSPSTRGVRMGIFLLKFAAGSGIARVHYQCTRCTSPADA
jgi:hypothetical protein